MALLRGDISGRRTILACLVLVTARLEQKTQAVGVAVLRGHESGRRTIIACRVLVTARLEQKTQAVGVAVLRGNESGRRTSLCLLYTSPSPRDRQKSRMPSSA